MQDQSLYSHINIPTFPEQEHLNCPRCDSPNTKFCYYNNYNLSQPRHYCKNCKRYWTKGGSLRNIPVGGGSRKNSKRSSITKKNPSLSSSSSSSSTRSLSSPKEDFNEGSKTFDVLLELVNEGHFSHLTNGLSPARPEFRSGEQIVGLGSCSGSVEGRIGKLTTLSKPFNEGQYNNLGKDFSSGRPELRLGEQIPGSSSCPGSVEKPLNEGHYSNLCSGSCSGSVEGRIEKLNALLKPVTEGQYSNLAKEFSPGRPELRLGE